MSGHPIRRVNHFVPRLYLKRWGSPDGKIWTYRLLAPHQRASLWKKSSLRGVAYREDLYTRIAAQGENDDVERWLDQEFETPAEDAIAKATTDRRLTREDWRRIIRFLAAQDVRTPGRLVENLRRWSGTLPELMQNTVEKSTQRLKTAHELDESIDVEPTPHSEYLPYKVTTDTDPDADLGRVTVETISGRGMWLFYIRHTLTSTIKALHQHRWTILCPPDGMSWITSDDPVVRLNFYGDSYDFRGGWGSLGTDIFMPLGPRHLLFTQIGSKPAPRGSVLSSVRAQMIQRFVAEHAHRMIFAAEPDSAVEMFRPRIVDAQAVRDERLQWQQWHNRQSTAERELMGWNPVE